MVTPPRKYLRFPQPPSAPRWRSIASSPDHQHHRTLAPSLRAQVLSYSVDAIGQPGRRTWARVGLGHIWDNGTDKTVFPVNGTARVNVVTCRDNLSHLSQNGEKLNKNNGLHWDGLRFYPSLHPSLARVICPKVLAGTKKPRSTAGLVNQLCGAGSVLSNEFLSALFLPLRHKMIRVAAL